MDEIFDEIESKTKKLYQALDKKLYDSVLEHIVDNLSIKDGIIKNTTANIGIIDSISSVFESKIKPYLIRIRDFILNAIERLIIWSYEDMTQYDTRAISIGEEVVKLMTDKAIRTVAQNVTLDRAFAEIKQSVIGLMSRPDGIALKDIRKLLEHKIIEKGITQTQFLTWTNNIYMQYQRAGSNEVRKKLKLTNAIYQGGLMKDSRNFCIERNGKVFSEVEIQSWVDVDFPEKWDPYNPFIDCGCYNCRHRLDWISDELAEKLKEQN